MKITNINHTETASRTRISASITWEDCDRGSEEIYFETESAFSQNLIPSPHPFLVASIFPALYSGEKRLHMDEEICPRLKEGLMTAMDLLHHWWYPSNRDVVAIEAKKIRSVPKTEIPKGAAFCFSGGVDSMATLYTNRLEYPESHPGYLRDGLLVFGLEVRDTDKFQNVLKSIASIADASNLTFIPVYTNLITLGPKDPKEFWEVFWLNEYMSAAFSSIAHAFSTRWQSFSINSSHDIPNLLPHGSNPLLTSCYGSWDLRIIEEGIRLSRFKKTELISDWDIALRHLRVCNITDSYQDGQLNCGKCEKCVRTMLALEAVGALKKATAFPVHTVTPALIEEAVYLRHNLLPLYVELLPPLTKAGRHDLVKAVSEKIREYHLNKKKEAWRKKAIQPIIDFDRKYLNGSMKKAKKQILDTLKGA
jgi:hypothetical protein